MDDLKEEYEGFKDSLREGFIKYTRKAFDMFPRLDRPRILDIGCGAGCPTLGLARLSDGEITGLDIDQPSLDRAAERIEEAGLSERVKVMNRSMFDMDFPDEHFDIIWAEGSIAAMGLERGLKEWRRLLGPGGFLAVHDEMGDVPSKLEQISGCGYELLDYFALSEEIWWDGYFAPLGVRIGEIRASCGDDPEALAMVEEDQRFVDMFRENPEKNSSVFFVMRKT